MKRAIFAAAGLVLLLPGVAAADLVPVRTQTAVVREAPLDGAQVLTTVKQGTWLEILAEEKGWFKVRTEKDVVGFVRPAGVDTARRKPGTLGSGSSPATVPASAGAPSYANQGGSGGGGLGSLSLVEASDDQSAAAGKGFDAETEAAYKAGHADLARAYEEVDQLVEMVERRQYHRDDALERFRQQGSLGEFAGARGR